MSSHTLSYINPRQWRGWCKPLRFFEIVQFIIFESFQQRGLTRAPLGYSAERAPLGGGGARFCPPCLTPELIGAARQATRRSKALNEKIPMHFKNFLKEVTCKVKVRSKVRNMFFGLLPIETGLSTVERPNSPKTLVYSRRAVQKSIMLKVSTDQGHGQVTRGHHEENYIKVARHKLYR